MSEPKLETNSTSITVPQVYAHPSQIPPDPRWQKILDLIIAWKLERDAKCADCKAGLELGRHGCHYDGDENESYSVGNCRAFGIARKIQQLEEAMRP
jgi:hypothetical protein